MDTWTYYTGGTAPISEFPLNFAYLGGTAVPTAFALEMARGDPSAQARVIRAYDESRCQYCSGKQRDLAAVKCCHCGAHL